MQTVARLVFAVLVAVLALFACEDAPRRAGHRPLDAGPPTLDGQVLERCDSDEFGSMRWCGDAGPPPARGALCFNGYCYPTSMERNCPPGMKFCVGNHEFGVQAMFRILQCNPNGRGIRELGLCPPDAGCLNGECL